MHDQSSPEPVPPLGTPTKSIGIITRAWPALLGLVGLIMLHGPMVRDGFGRVHGNLIDGRLVALLLEHAHQWIAGRVSGFFSPTWLYYPYPKALTLTETMLGATPLYSPLRFAGMAPLHAFQLWMVLSSALAYAATYALARALKIGGLSAALAAFLCTFGMARVTAAHHPQLLFFLPTPLCLLAVLQYLKVDSAGRRCLWLIGVALIAAWQTWAAGYLGVFLVLGIAVACLAALAMRDTRPRLVTLLRRDFHMLALAAIVYAAALLPLITASLPHRALLARTWSEVATYLPTPAAFVFPHGRSLLYGWLHDTLAPCVNDPSESQLFSGLAALLAPFGLWLLARHERRQAQPVFDPRLARLLLLTWLGLTVLMLGDLAGHSLWWLPWHLPGIRNIRAIGRLALLVLFPASLALGFFATWIEERLRHGRLIVIVLTVFVVLENAVDNRYLFSVASHERRIAKVEAALRRHPENPCPAFFYKGAGVNAWADHLDAMWVSMRTHVPTLNGWAGAEPPGWSFRQTASVKAEDLLRWAHTFAPSLERVCVVGDEHPR
jgi:hypothetical protein